MVDLCQYQMLYIMIFASEKAITSISTALYNAYIFKPTAPHYNFCKQKYKNS